MYACNNIAKLEKQNYCITDWIPISFEETKSGIILEVETDFGLKKFVFDTGCTAVLIQFKNIEEAKLFEKGKYDLPAYTTSKFIIGSHNFSDIKLHQLQLSSIYQEVDGFLGMNFIEDYQIYIDYKNRKMYINPTNFNQ